MSSTSVPSRDFLRSEIPVSIAFFSSAETLSPCSFKLFSVEKTKLSAWFLASTDSLFSYQILCLLQHP